MVPSQKPTGHPRHLPVFNPQIWWLRLADWTTALTFTLMPSSSPPLLPRPCLSWMVPAASILSRLAQANLVYGSHIWVTPLLKDLQKLFNAYKTSMNCPLITFLPASLGEASTFHGAIDWQWDTKEKVDLGLPPGSAIYSVALEKLPNFCEPLFPSPVL